MWEVILGGVLVVVLMIYTLTGGADFGGGVWDLFASGPRADRQRTTIGKAIGPIWEANHVWLIILIVLLFVCFPKAFAILSTALHLPLTLCLFGIVLRGSAFVFRKYDPDNREAWRRVFAIASLVTPMMLGMTLAATSGGYIRIDQQGRWMHQDGYLATWLQPFPFMAGLLAVALCALLAAVYLLGETDDADLREDFRRRALTAAVAVGILAFATLGVALSNAPHFGWRLSGSAWAIPFQLLAGATALSVFACLWLRRNTAAKFAVGAQAVVMLSGWALAQFPYLIVPGISIADAAASEKILAMTFWILAGGMPLLLPSFFYLYRVFSFSASR